MYNQKTIYIIGDAKTASNNPITQRFHAFFIGLVVNRHTGVIEDADCSSTIPLTTQFIKSVLIGKSIDDVEGVTSEIEHRYFGSSQRAFVVAFKNASIKFKQITKH